jgi:hypothetical protein
METQIVNQLFEFDLVEESEPTLMNWVDQWKEKADEQYRASELLFKTVIEDLEYIKLIIAEGRMPEQFERKPSVLFPYLYMVSVSIENLIKGILLYRNRALTTQHLDRSIINHNLTVLGKQLHIYFTKAELNFLSMASLVLKWYGKYPIPTKAKDQVKQATIRFVDIRKTYLSLFNKLSQEMVDNCQLAPWHIRHEDKE